MTAKMAESAQRMAALEEVARHARKIDEAYPATVHVDIHAALAKLDALPARTGRCRR